jgi:hypothetical protein
MAAMGEMPDMTGQEMAVGAMHRFAPLKGAFCCQNGASKRLNEPYITDLYWSIKVLPWSDPEV